MLAMTVGLVRVEALGDLRVGALRIEEVGK
jgi:hypothetical protein